MKILLDTHLLLWAASASGRIPQAARDLIDSPDSEPFFSAVSIWEVAIKAGLKHRRLDVEPLVLEDHLLRNGYQELPVRSVHGAAVATLPRIHNDPFDRLLIAQALVEGMELLTVDRVVASYPAPIRRF